MCDTTCPDCGIEMDHIEKTTITGRDMREYECSKCKRTQIGRPAARRFGRFLSDARKLP